MSNGNASDNSSNTSNKSLAQVVFTEMKHDDPVFLELKRLLLNGRRSEAINLVCKHDSRFQDSQAKEFIGLIMHTLRDTIVDKPDQRN